MEWQRLFFLLFLVPALIFGLDHKECESKQAQISEQWNRHNHLIEQFQALENKEEGIHCLQESINSCNRGIAICNEILQDIASQSTKKRNEAWRVSMKGACEKDRKTLQEEINQIQEVISHVRAGLMYRKSVNLAQEANLLNQHCTRTLHNVDTVIAMLHDVKKMFGEAATFSREALNPNFPGNYTYVSSTHP